MANNFLAKDGAGITQTFGSIDTGVYHIPKHILVDSTGAPIIGRQTMAASFPAVLPSDMPLLGMGLLVPSDNFTRPADTTPYAHGDLVANDVDAADVVVLSFTVARFAAGAFRIHRGRLLKTTTLLTNATFKLHLYSAAPSIANGDNAAWSTTLAAYLGALQVTVDRAGSDGSYGDLLPFNGVPISHKLSSGSSIKGLIEARPGSGATYTPGNAEVFTATLEVETT